MDAGVRVNEEEEFQGPAVLTESLEDGATRSSLDLIQTVGNDISGRHEKTPCLTRLFSPMAADVPPPFAAQCDEIIMLGYSISFCCSLQEKQTARREETNEIWQCGKLRH